MYMYAYAQWKVFFCRKKRTSNVKGLIRILFRFFFALVFLFIVYVCCVLLLLLCQSTNIQKCLYTHRNREREKKNLKAKRAHTQQVKKIWKSKVCGVFTFPFYFRNYFYVSYVCVSVQCSYAQWSTHHVHGIFFSSYSSFFFFFLVVHSDDDNRSIASTTLLFYICSRTHFFAFGLFQSVFLIVVFFIQREFFINSFGISAMERRICVDDRRWRHNID